MKKADVEEHMRLVENFRSHLSSLATKQADAGEDFGAGLLLVLERRVYRGTNDWRTSFQLEDEGAPATAAPTPKCKHEFVIEELNRPPVCSKCGATKKANGRPKKTEAAVPPPPAFMMPGGTGGT